MPPIFSPISSLRLTCVSTSILLGGVVACTAAEGDDTNAEQALSNSEPSTAYDPSAQPSTPTDSAPAPGPSPTANPLPDVPSTIEPSAVPPAAPGAPPVPPAATPADNEAPGNMAPTSNAAGAAAGLLETPEPGEGAGARPASSEGDFANGGAGALPLGAAGTGDSGGATGAGGSSGATGSGATGGTGATGADATGEALLTYAAGFDQLFIHDECTAPYPQQPDTCLHELSHEEAFTFGGDAGTTYDVTLRVRGLFEPTTISGGQTPYAEHPYFKEGGTVAALDYSHWHIEVSEPPQTYWLNHYPQTSHTIYKEDFEVTLPVAGGSNVTVRVIDGNDRQIDNAEEGLADRQQLIEGVTDEVLDGQVLRLDVIDVVAR